MADGVPCQYFGRKMKMNSSLGVNLRVTGHCNQGDRKYMEDMFCVAYQQTEDGEDLEYAYFGIFDGHGGKEAAVFARERLMEFIVNEKKFWSDDDEDVLSAIKCGYLATHHAMWQEQVNWPKTPNGLPSTSGTTATIAFIRNGKIYVGHVGDSSVVLGFQSSPGPPHESEWLAKALTKDHKPESHDEISRIQKSGGKVSSKSGIPRVVWNRPRVGHQGPVRRSTTIDEVPFLAVARSLGDLWSYNADSDQFVVSPEPDVGVVKIDTSIHRCLIFGTDGFWNMVTPSEAVLFAQKADRQNEAEMILPEDQQIEMPWVNPSKYLVDHALRKWSLLGYRADNTSVVTLLLNPPCSQGGCQPSKTAIVSHNQEQETTPLSEPIPKTMPSSSTDPEPSEFPVESDEPNHHISPLTKVIRHLPVPGRTELQDPLKLKNPLNDISPLLNTNRNSCCEDLHGEKNYTSHCLQPVIQCERIDSLSSHERKTAEERFSRPDDRLLSTPEVDNPDTPSPMLHPVAASTPAYSTSGVCYLRNAASKSKAAEALQRRGRHPVKGILNVAGSSAGKVLPLSSNVESGSHLRGLKRRHSSVWENRNSSSEVTDLKKRTRSEDKLLLGSNALNNSDEKYNREDTENERVVWPSNWLSKIHRCDEGSEENLSCTVRRRKRWMQSTGMSRPSNNLRKARSRSSLYFDKRENSSRTLRSDTYAASQSRTLRSRNVDVKSPVKLPVLASKIASTKRGMHLRAALTAHLSPFSRSSLLEASKGAGASPKRRPRSVANRSRV